MPYFKEHKTAIVYTNVFASYFRTKFELTVDCVQKNKKMTIIVGSMRFNLFCL